MGARHDARDRIARNQAGTEVLRLVRGGAQQLELQNIARCLVRIAGDQRAHGLGEAMACPPPGIAARQVVGQLGTSGHGLAHTVAGHENALAAGRAQLEELHMAGIQRTAQCPGVREHGFEHASTPAALELVQQTAQLDTLLRGEVQNGVSQHRRPPLGPPARCWLQRRPALPGAAAKRHRSSPCGRQSPQPAPCRHTRAA